MKNYENERKVYMKLAKSRLQNATNVLTKQEETYIFNSKKLSDDEVKSYQKTVSEILASETFIDNPLDRLINHQEFDPLTDEGKMRYILEVSKLFKKIQENYKR